MAARRPPLWSGTLAFGLVSVPVALTPAVRSKRSAFHLLHEKDGARLRRRMYCPADKAFVPPEEIVRGREVADGRHVIVGDEEIAAIAPDRSRAIEIQIFVDRDDIDPALYDRPYYLVPTGAERPYRLLVETLAELNRAGIAEFVMNARERLCAVLSIDGALCLMILRYPEALRPAGDLAPEVEAEPGVATSMGKAISAMTIDFDPDQLQDKYAERVRKLIQRKKRRDETVTAPAPEAETASSSSREDDADDETVDLLSELEESLKQEKEKEGASSSH